MKKTSQVTNNLYYKMLEEFKIPYIQDLEFIKNSIVDESVLKDFITDDMD